MSDLMDSGAARRFLGITNRAQFWRVIRDNDVPHHVWGPRTISFDPEILTALRIYRTVRGPEDERRLADKRMTFRAFLERYTPESFASAPKASGRSAAGIGHILDFSRAVGRQGRVSAPGTTKAGTGAAR